MYILGGVWKAGVFWSAGQLFRNILPERKNRHHHHRGYIFVTFITSFSKTTKLFSSNLMNKAPNGNEAGDQTFAIFLKRQRNNFFFITFVCLPGKHWKVQREFLSGYLDNLTGRNKEEIQEVAEISHFTKGGSVGPSRVFSSMLM